MSRMYTSQQSGMPRANICADLGRQDHHEAPVRTVQGSHPHFVSLVCLDLVYQWGSSSYQKKNTPTSTHSHLPDRFSQVLSDFPQSAHKATTELGARAELVIHIPNPTYHSLHHRTIPHIYNAAVGWHGGNYSTLVTDMERIATWKLQLDKILITFNIRFPGFVRQLLTLLSSDRVGDQWL